jgi:hypothetical protein
MKKNHNLPARISNCYGTIRRDSGSISAGSKAMAKASPFQFFVDCFEREEAERAADAERVARGGISRRIGK